MKRVILVFMLCLFWALSASADAVKDKLDRLESQVKAFHADSVSRNEKVASALATIEQLRSEYQSIQGTIEANGHIIKQQEADISRLQRDTSDQFAAINDRLEIYGQQISKAVGKVMPSALTETANYQKALDMVRNSEFLTAVSAFRSFLKSNPKSDLADNAQYWIGECYFAMKDYPKAIKEFQVMIDKHGRADKAPAAILKQGYAFAELGMPEEAKTFLNKVIKDYPSSSEATMAKDKLDRLNQKEAQALSGTPALGSTPTTTMRPYDSHDGIPLAPGLKSRMQKTDLPEKTDLPTTMGRER